MWMNLCRHHDTPTTSYSWQDHICGKIFFLIELNQGHVNIDNHRSWPLQSKFLFWFHFILYKVARNKIVYVWIWMRKSHENFACPKMDDIWWSFEFCGEETQIICLIIISMSHCWEHLIYLFFNIKGKTKS